MFYSSFLIDIVNPKKIDPLQNHVHGQAGRLSPFFKACFAIKIQTQCQEKISLSTNHIKYRNYVMIHYVNPLLWKGDADNGTNMVPAGSISCWNPENIDVVGGGMD